MTLKQTIQIVKDVQQLKPSANIGSVRTCIRRDLVKDGVIVKAGNDSIYEFILYLKFWMAKAEKIKEVVEGRQRNS